MRPVTRRGGAIEHARSDQARMRSAQLELERAQTYADRAHRNSTPASPTTVSSPAPRARMGATLTQIRAAASFPAHRATSAHEDYLDVIHRAVEHCGGRVNLIGDCQGGWLATIYAALYPEHINTLTLAGALIDFHAGEPVVHEVLRRLAPGGDLRFYEALVKADGGVLKGEHMSAQAVISGCSWATRHSASTGRRSSPKFCGIRPPRAPTQTAAGASTKASRGSAPARSETRG
jgi:pimeloyl-ACP methyl ester carboxylesterase